MEVILGVGVCGVVTRDTKGSAQGMITVTDGSSLDMPLHLRFPKVRVSSPFNDRLPTTIPSLPYNVRLPTAP